MSVKKTSWPIYLIGTCSHMTWPLKKKLTGIKSNTCFKKKWFRDWNFQWPSMGRVWKFYMQLQVQNITSFNYYRHSSMRGSQKNYFEIDLGNWAVKMLVTQYKVDNRIFFFFSVLMLKVQPSPKNGQASKCCNCGFYTMKHHIRMKTKHTSLLLSKWWD